MKNQMKIILLCVFINVTIICLIIIAYCLLHADNIRINMKAFDYSTYRSELVNHSNVNSKLSLFPEKISRKEVVDIQYLKGKDSKNKSYFLYLMMDYDEDTYRKEVKRLEKIDNILKENLLNVTYITIFNKNGTYEYAILEEEENKIIYVYNQLTDWSKTKIEKDYIIDLKNMNNQLIGYDVYIDNDS